MQVKVLLLLLHQLSTVCRGQIRVTSLAHDSALLPCKFDFIRGSEDLLVIWEKVEKDGKKVQVYKSVDGRSDLSSQDSMFSGRTYLPGDIAEGSLDLNLTVVTMNDDGVYYCRAANKINHGDNMVELSVRAPPPEQIEKAAEDDVTLVPKYFGVPKEITWMVNNRKLVEMELMPYAHHFYYLADRAHLDLTGRLTITNLTKEDSGLYKSQVLVTNIIQETEIVLSVIDRVSKPVIYDSSTREEIKLLCNSSSSNVSYKWRVKHRGEPVSTKQEYIAPKPKEEVVLICTVSDTMSEDSTAITIRDVPPAFRRRHFAVIPSGFIALMTLPIALVLWWKRKQKKKIPCRSSLSPNLGSTSMPLAPWVETSA